MKRRPRPLVVTTALPTLAALVSAGLVEGCRPKEPFRTANPPPPPPPRSADAGTAHLPPTPIDPSNLPIAPAGAIAPVHPVPAPAPRMDLQGATAPAPSAAIPAAPAPSAVAAQANAEAQADSVWGARPSAAARPMIVHNHPPGTPCTPIARAELERAVTNAPR